MKNKEEYQELIWTMIIRIFLTTINLKTSNLIALITPLIIDNSYNNINDTLH
jgi:hypothetical protein